MNKLVKRDEDFAQWFQQVIANADLADNAPVRGCMVIKPYGYAIWERIQAIVDERIKAMGVSNAYFPLLIPLEMIAKEADHIEGFAKECAVVTHHRLVKDENGGLKPDGELTMPYIIRPTSEAIIGSIIKDWIRSYRDLPLKLNQWCNVMRWEMRPRLFLRTSEFLWQEGHNVFASVKEAQEDAKKMADFYYNFIAEDLTLPVFAGEKTAEERFPGACNTYTMEVLTQDFKCLQAATSHYLGQSFAKAFGLKFLNNSGQEEIAFTTSWGLTTRLIGAVIMCHGDDEGLVLPLDIAPYQVLIIPIIHNINKLEEIFNNVYRIEGLLRQAGLRVKVDSSENSVPDKIWRGIKQGVPLTIEIGSREIEENTFSFATRNDRKAKKKGSLGAVATVVLEALTQYKSELKNKAENFKKEHLHYLKNLNDLEDFLQTKKTGFCLLDFLETENSKFGDLAKGYSVSRRCIIDGTTKVLIAKSY